MAIKTYLISCLIILANCNVRATNVADDCEDSEGANGGYFASGSAHSSQFLLPNGEEVTHSKGSSYTSGGIKQTFEHLKHEANQFVSKQKDTLKIPNPLPPLHSGLDQDLHHIFDIGQIAYTAPSVGFNAFESASQQKKEIYGAGQNGQVYYPQAAIPQTSKVVSTKKEFQVNKKVVTHGASGLPAYPSGNEEIEVNQNGLDSISAGDTYFQHIPSSSFQNVHYQSGNAHKEVETLDSGLHQPIVPVQNPQKLQALPLSQNSYSSKYETSVKQNSTSQLPIQAYIPTGTFTSGIIDLTSNDGLTSYIGNRVPSKLTLSPERHYDEERDSINYNENSETNAQQKVHKYHAVPINQVPQLPLKIKYTYDGKTLKKFEVYEAGVLKQVPISVEETENTLKEIKSQVSSQNVQYAAQPSSQIKEKEPEGYYYPIQSQSSPASQVQTFKKEESSHSHQTYSSGDSSIATNAEQFAHLPLNIDSQKQYGQGYLGVLPPVAASQISEEKVGQATQVLANQPAILVRGAPQYIPLQNQQSDSTFHSSSHFSGANGGFLYPQDYLFDTQSTGSAFQKHSALNQNSGSLYGDDLGSLIGGSKLPLKSSYGVSTSFSSSSSNINGKKSENRQASVSVNDNGKVDTYNVKS